MKINQTIKTIYLYIVSLIALIFILVNAGILINMALQTWVFTKADQADVYYERPPIPVEYLRDDQNEQIAQALRENPDLTEKQQQDVERWLADYEQFAEQRVDPAERSAARKQRDAARSLAYLLVATPVFMYHWKLARKERE